MIFSILSIPVNQQNLLQDGVWLDYKVEKCDGKVLSFLFLPDLRSKVHIHDNLIEGVGSPALFLISYHFLRSLLRGT